MFTRKIAKLLRGKATPYQLITACVLGSALGFIPGFGQAAGLMVLLVLLLVILLALMLLPVSFYIGRGLLDGPTEGLFAAIVNAPVLALFGFEYYATTGGFVLGIIVGLVMGFGLVKGLSTFRGRMSRLEEGSPKFVAISRKWWARTLAFLLVGKGHGKKTYQQLLEKKVGNPIRTVGAVFAVLVIGLLVVLYQFVSEPIVTSYMRAGLERANGATVDLDSADLSLAEGRLTVTGFAMADPNDLSRDLLRAQKLEADLSAASILRKRVALDRLVFIDASTGEQRKVPGRHIGRPPKAQERKDITIPDAEKLEEYIGNAAEWKERLAQVRRWLERIGGSGEGEEDTRGERAASAARDSGYARARASHLIADAPTAAVYELIAERVRVPYLDNETLDIHGENLSTHPHLLGKPPRLTVRSSGGTLDAAARFEQFGGGGGGGANALELHCRGIPGDVMGKQLAFSGGAPPLQGGTVDVDATGRWTGGPSASINMPLTVTVRNSTIALPGASPQRVDQLVLPIGVRGPLDDPRIVIDDDAFADALVQAGASELAGRFHGELAEKIGEELPPELGGDVGEALQQGLGGLLGGEEKKEEKDAPKPDG
jgi:hypothetical protein